MDRTNLQKKEHKCKVIMVQGTMSGAGKSLVVAGLCRVFAQDGYRVAPFKSQNMALNSYITDEGLEMGRAQVMQAEAAGVRPEVAMNPILLKPTSDSGSQVIVNGRVVGNMTAREYFAHKKRLIPDITKAFEKLADKNDIIVIEGAGSPAEINLKSEDIVNMGMAELVDSNVLLVGDIDRGGVFAQLLGTLMLLEDKEKARVKGLIINKFRGDKTILDPGIEMLGARCDVQVAGVLPYADIRLDDEDSLTSRFDRKDAGLIDIVVIRLPRIANISDFTCFEIIDGVSLRYVDNPDDIARADMVIIPGSKNTIADLKWMRETGIEAAIKKYAKRKDQSEANGYTDSGIVFGICGGYQMLGNNISDPHGIEDGGSIRGMELLPIDTVIENEKTRTRVSGRVTGIDGPLSSLEGCQISGYEIHMGKSTSKGIAIASLTVESDEENNTCMDGAQNGSVYGSYVHGIFDDGDMASKIVRILADRKGVSLGESEVMKYDEYKEKQYDMLADMIRKHMNMELIYSILKDANITTQ